MDFIKTLIEDTLKRLNEEELEVPFRNLLRSMGHIPISEKTIHGPGEHGKDIVSSCRVDATNEVYVFSLKTGDISLNRFRTKVKPQFDPMFQVPISHPLISGNEQKRYILVSTGDLSSDAAVEFEAYNEDNLRINRPKVELWSRSILVDLFYKNMESLPAFTVSFRDNLTQIWLDVKSGKYNRSDWLSLADAIISSSSEDVSEKPLLSLGLAASFLVSQARLSGEFLIAFDIFKIALINSWKAVMKLDHLDSIFDQIHEEYCNLISACVDDLKEDMLKKYGLFKHGNDFSESILYPIRTFSVLGLLSYLAYFHGERGEKEKENQFVEFIGTIIGNNPSALTPIADSQRKDIAISLFELCRNRKSDLAEKWIEGILENLYQRYVRSGWWPSGSDSAEGIIEDTFHFEGRKKEQPSSFLIPILFSFCAKLGAQRTYNHYRVLFGDFRMLEFDPPNDVALAEAELISNTLEHGTTIEKSFPLDFQDYRKQVSQFSFRKYRAIEKNRRYVLHLITEAYENYVFPEIYLNFDIE